MGRLTELFEFINAEDAPAERDMRVRYTYITKNEELMDARKAYRKELRTESPQGLTLPDIGTNDHL